MSRPVEAELAAARERLVLHHVEAENAHDLEAVIATFTHPRYEIVPTGVVHDGERAVRAMLQQQWADLPELRFSAEAVFHGPFGVAVETRTTGRSPSGSPVDLLSVNVFGFDGTDLVVERCHFDRMAIAEALGYTAEGA